MSRRVKRNGVATKVNIHLKLTQHLQGHSMKEQWVSPTIYVKPSSTIIAGMQSKSKMVARACMWAIQILGAGLSQRKMADQEDGNSEISCCIVKLN